MQQSLKRDGLPSLDELVSCFGQWRGGNRESGPAPGALSAQQRQEQRDAQLREALTQLHALLIAPIAAQLRPSGRVVFFPAGALTRVPFAALRAAGEEEPQPCLLEQHTVHVGVSMWRLLRSISETSVVAEQPVMARRGSAALVVGYPHEDVGQWEALQPLWKQLQVEAN